MNHLELGRWIRETRSERDAEIMANNPEAEEGSFVFSPRPDPHPDAPKWEEARLKAEAYKEAQFNAGYCSCGAPREDLSNNYCYGCIKWRKHFNHEV